jgi:hypothetical protein
VLNHALTPKENTVRTRFVLPVVLAGVLLSQHACAGQADQSGTASSTSGLGSAAPVTSLAAPVATPAQSPTKLPASPAKATSAAAGGVLSGTRQVYILPENNEATVAVDKAMKAGLSEDFDNRALFVFKPDGDRFSIRTAKLRVNDDPTNETFCLVVRSGKVVATACDSSDSNQLFHVIKSGSSTSGKPTYVIRTKDYVFLRVATPAANLTATKIEEGTADAGTDFLLPDKGKASLPALD